MHVMKVIIAAIALNAALVLSEQQWTYDLISIESTSSDTSKAEVDLEVVRVSRGVYAFSGYLHLHEDLTQRTTIDIQVYRSKTEKDEDYEITPFTVDNELLPAFMNNHYKNMLMDAAKECAPEAPQFVNFLPPLKAHRIEFTNCQIATDGFPDKMSEGKYKIEAKIRQDATEVYLEVILFIVSL